MKQTYSWFIDLATSADKIQTVHVSAGGKECANRLLPFFTAYKYYKLGPVSVKFVPASTLPVDPTGLSYGAGENTVDPRDQFNPGLIRITNGEDTVIPHSMDSYYSLMVDRRWYKFQLQSGARRTCMPRLWSVAQLHQTAFPDEFRNLPNTNGQNQVFNDSETLSGTLAEGITANHKYDVGSDPRGLFQTSNNARLGWLPTDASTMWESSGSGHPRYEILNPVPEVPVLTIILPQAFKTLYYYRLYLTETVYFKDPVALNVSSVISPGQILPTNGSDRFIYPSIGYGSSLTAPPDYPLRNDGSDFREDRS